MTNKTLKGQNLRVLLRHGSETKYKVVAKSTSCTINITVNTEDASHKDIVSSAAMPTATSIAWNVQVESLDVTDMAAILQAIKEGTAFDLAWTETTTVNNQTPAGTDLVKTGKAFLNDATFTFNDRENSTKQIQFTGTSSLGSSDLLEHTEIITVDNNFTKGQFVRLFITNGEQMAIAAAKGLTFHVSVQLETSTTKDTVGMWAVQEPVGLSYDMSTNALVRSNDNITSSVLGASAGDMQNLIEEGETVPFQIANVSGDNNRTKGTILVSGNALITNFELSAPNRQVATYTVQMQGYGDYTVGS